MRSREKPTGAEEADGHFDRSQVYCKCFKLVCVSRRLCVRVRVRVPVCVDLFVGICLSMSLHVCVYICTLHIYI